MTAHHDQPTGEGPTPAALDGNLELLDRQIVDHDGLMVGKVDDVELTERESGRLVVTGLLTGPGALGSRLGGALGNVVVGRATVSVDGFETWVRDRVIAAIPGSGVNPE